MVSESADGARFQHPYGQARTYMYIHFLPPSHPQEPRILPTRTDILVDGGLFVDGGFAHVETTRITIEGDEHVKKHLHPTVRQVVFKDVSSDFSFLGASTMDSKETIEWEDGKSYPLIKVEISSASHPFFTGKQRVLETEGRISRFKRKHGQK